ncbi:MAG TPA: glycoside hydrolase N-terminal domain-containing protein [Candidatus Sumerlaeota bacterium]|nr:glycoside hydrolase N-terminal domain-containing protein [Candidatus Sumerlaeota bacterium]
MPNRFLRRSLPLVLLCLLPALPLFAQAPDNALPLRIGVDQTGGNAFRGEIAAVRVYDRALSAAEVKQQAETKPEAKGALSGVVGEWVRPKLPVTSDQKFDFPRGLTVEAWIRPEAGSVGRIVDKITPGGSDGFLLDTHPGNALRWIVGTDTIKCDLPPSAEWVHAVATVGEDGLPSLYVNGARTAGSGADSDGVTVNGAQAGPGKPLTLWYRRPAAQWTDASPIGNGRLGGMVWGGAKKERIDLNEDTLWSGEPYNNLNPKGLKSLPEIRRLIVAGKNTEAQQLVERDMNGKYNQNYLPLGDLTIEFPVAGEVSDYRRELDLEQAVARVQFEHQGVRYTREIFASNPAQAIVVRLTSDQPGKISFNAALGCQLHHTTKAEQDFLRQSGRCPAHSDPSYYGKSIVWDDAPDGKGMRFETRLVPVHQGGRVTITDTGIVAEGCDSVTLLLVAATSYNGPDKSPSREGRDPAKLCDDTLAPLAGQPYEKIRQAHVTDHQRLFNRVTLDLGRSAADERPTDVRLKAYQPGQDPALAALYYQFGRYLLIAASRPGTQPSNLQGIWNHQMQPPWSANWTLNCNAQINYWPVETANLAECHLPLIDLTTQLSVDGHNIARNLYGVDGWVAHHNTDIWRQAGPVSGSAVWSMFPVGGAWLCQHVWEHYAFSGDTEYLRRVWPVLKGAARFYLDYMMEEPSHGWLVTAPDTNYEKPFKKPNGETGCTCMGATASMEMVRELLQNCAQATRVLGTDAELCAEIEKALPRLPPLQVSPTTGELQEWLEDWQRTAECQVLSSWGAICGTQITPRGTPELAAALRKIFDTNPWWKNGNTGSWQGAFQANVYARLGDGDMALNVLDMHLRRSVNPNLTAHFKNAGSEFQIDGNLGQTAAVGEMLLQSHTGTIELLPALPKAWSDGKVTGLRARGNVTVDIEWKDGKITRYRLASPEPRDVKVRVNGETQTVKTERI